jgi:S-formylglutathione hydrolase FrmB
MLKGVSAVSNTTQYRVLTRSGSIAGVKLTRDPDARATIGLSSSGAAALSMAWFHPELYHRVVAWSGTFVNQQWPHNPALPGGAWEFHSPYAGPIPPLLNTSGFALPTPSTQAPGSPLILTSPKQPMRIWLQVGDKDLFYPLIGMPDGMHDWVLANENMAKALAAKGYEYQFIFARNAGHFDFATFRQTLPQALEYVWADFLARKNERDDD